MRKHSRDEVDALERQVRALKARIAAMRDDPGDMPFTGCGDSSCIVAAPKGMCTNGGCRCDERTLRQAVLYWRRVAQFRQVNIQALRGDFGPGEGD